MACVDLDVEYCGKYCLLVNNKNFSSLTNKLGDDQVGDVDQETIDAIIKVMKIHVSDPELCISVCNWLSYISTNSKNDYKIK